MKYWISGLAALIAVETAAIACSCLATTEPAELRRLAPEAAKGAVALVEVETLLSYAESNGAGDRMRVVQTLAGKAPAEFRVERGPMPSSASCDLLWDKGQRGTVILYPARTPKPAQNPPVYRISGLCTDHMLDQPVFRDEIIRLMGGASWPGERG